jgi:hypothetical protein
VTQATHARAPQHTNTGTATPTPPRALDTTHTPSRTRPALALAVVSATCLFLLAAAPALASTAHTYAGQFASAGTGPGQFTGGGPNALAINQTTGDVFALDTARTNAEFAPIPRVERFNAGGDFQSAFNIDPTKLIGATALAFDPATTGSVYVGGLNAETQATGEVLKYSAAGVLAYALDPTGTETTLGYPVSLAVDANNGDVFVNAATTTEAPVPVIDEFDKTGKFIASFDGSTVSPDGAFGAVSALAADSAHRLYVLDSGKGRVDRYTESGEWQATVDNGSRGAPSAVSADPTSGELDILEAGALGQQVTRFSAAGAAPIESFGAGHIAGAGAVAVTHSSGTVYTADAGITAIERFTIFIAPTVTTTAASAVSASEATLNGTVNPEGVAGGTSYHFEWGTETAYGNVTAETPAGEGKANVAAASTITGLTPGTTYHFRLDATNASGSVSGADETFTTAAAAPTVDVQGPPVASAISTKAATFSDTLNPNGADTTYRFEYGTSTAYGASTTDADAGALTGEAPASSPATGLEPGKTYHFRVVAENGVGTPVDGADATFTTAPATAPTASAVSAVSATLNATVIPTAAGSSYRFEYGTDTTYGTSTPEHNLAAGPEAVPVSSGTFALLPGTTYHFRLLATTNGQTVSSDDTTFTTIAAAAVTTSAVTEVTTTTATLNATIDTHGVAGTSTFSITSPSSAYAAASAPVALSATSGPQTVSVPVTGLPPGLNTVGSVEKYILVQASATVAGTTAWGEQAKFETPDLPPFNPPAPAPAISAHPYGCTAPQIAAVNVHPKPGDTVTVSGSDLGLGGTIALGAVQVPPSTWSATGFAFVVPDGTTGSQPLTVNCGVVSNTVGLTILSVASNTFTIIKATVKGTTATVTVKVPGPGRIQVSGGKSSTASKTVNQAGTTSLTVSLTKTGKKALAKAHSKKLSAAVRVTFTPAGGTAATQSRALTFKRGEGR